MHAEDAKTQKIEPDPNFCYDRKVLEAVCKRDWLNARSYLFTKWFYTLIGKIRQFIQKYVRSSIMIKKYSTLS